MTRPHPLGTLRRRVSPRAAVSRRLGRPWRALNARRVQRRLAGPKLLRAFADVYPEAFFIEIGSNDGEQHDHLRPFIHSHRWRGVMVEPVPYVFERLCRNYSGFERITLENAVVAERDGVMPFYYLDEVEAPDRERLPAWYDGIGSLSREAVLSHANRIPDIEDRLAVAEVPSLTFESLCAKHGIHELDLILIDTEGYDDRILSQIDLATRRPQLLIYEHYHLGGAARAECRQRLERVGYESMEEGFDTFCLDPASDHRLLDRWRRLRPAVPGVSVDDEAR
jgi:FkbM family methyltransferase